MLMLATRTARTAAAAVIAVGALAMAHAFTTGEPAASRHISASASDLGTEILPPDATYAGDKADVNDVTWGH